MRFDDSQRSSLLASVAARMQHLGLAREDDYLTCLRGAAPRMVETELRNLLNLVTVTETCFFRDASQFRLLREYIVPALLAERSAQAGPRTLRIWSAGCSSGEEAYSIALALEAMGLYRACPEWTIEITGTDLNTKVLESARRAVYSERAVRNVERLLLDTYFRREGKTFALSDAVKDRVRFEFGNLTQTPMPSTGPQDIVFCKNVGIYFRPEVMRKLIAGLRDTLVPGGYLLLGHAESLWQMSEGFALVEYERAFCYRKPGSPAPFGDRHQRASAAPAAARPRFAASQAAVARASGDYEFCLTAFRAGDWSAAESALDDLVAACPTFVPALLLRGGIYANSGRFEEASAQAAAALRLSDLEPRAHLLAGMVAARQQRYDEALQSLRRALYLDDSLALAHFWLGNLYRARGDLARARGEYESVVRDFERHTLELTEEFAQDLTVEQLVEFCRQHVDHG